MVLKFWYHPCLYDGNQIQVPHALWKMVLKFQEWHRDSVTIRKICIAPSTIISEPYLIEPSQMLRHPTACDGEREDSVYWAFPYRINRAFTSRAPYLEVSHPPLVVPRLCRMKRAHCLAQ